MNKTVIIIFGPTGVGKSKTAVEVAKKLNGEIISCDSMQVFSGLNIGTAKITEKEMKGIRHHLLSFVNPKDEFSVWEYVKIAEEKIEEIFKKNKQPIIVGGTGLYINALVNNYDFGNAEENNKLREKYKKIIIEKGNEFLFNILKNKDPKKAELININDTKRIIRALEILENKKEIKVNKKNKYNYLIFGLNLPREKLYEYINIRCEEMFKNGLVIEVKNLLDYGLTSENQSMKGIGYKEVITGLNQNKSIEEITELVKQKTRNYAKRQLTFMRGIKDLIWIDAINASEKILEVINGR